jgi:hypothetical protein
MVEWDKVLIKTDSGPEIMGIAPVIISASRSTDIPGCYSDWFMHRLLGPGYVGWINPFNRALTRVSFEKTRAVVFWTKNAEPMVKHFEALDRRGIEYYFQYTLNDYTGEGYEPGIPRLEARISTFRKVSELLGKERVVWRFDPIILRKTITPEEILTRISRLGEELKDHTERLVFSYVDIAAYAKVRGNLVDGERDCGNDEMLRIAEGIADLNKGWGLELFTCGESVSLENFGIGHGSCVDGALLERIAPHDDALMRFIDKHGKKDAGQRKECGCIPSKDIGQYDTCPHMCRYCYANRNERVVKENRDRHIQSPCSETILGEDASKEKNQKPLQTRFE